MQDRNHPDIDQAMKFSGERRVVLAESGRWDAPDSQNTFHITTDRVQHLLSWKNGPIRENSLMLSREDRVKLILAIRQTRNAETRAEGIRFILNLILRKHTEDITPASSLAFPHPDSVDFSGFTGREGRMRRVLRYGLYTKSLYRSDIYTHARRLFFLLTENIVTLKKYLPNLRVDYTQILTLVHDDGEMITDDFPSSQRIVMSPGDACVRDQYEREAIDELAGQFPNSLHGYSYRDLLMDIHDKKSLEAQLVKFLDHLDGYGEALHEIFAGNHEFLHDTMGPYGENVNPLDSSLRRLREWETEYPLLVPLFRGVREQKEGYREFPFDCEFSEYDFHTACAKGKKHTPKSLSQKSGYLFYDWWKRTLMNSGDREVIAHLLLESQNAILLTNPKY